MQINRLIERMTKIHRSQRFGIYLVMYLLIGVAYFFLFYTPALATQQEYVTSAQTLRGEMERVRQDEARVRDLEQEMAELSDELRELERELPEQGEITDFLRAVHEEATAVGLEVTTFTRIEEIPIPERYYAEVPVEIEIYGQYHEVARFFDLLRQMQRIVYVQDIEMSSPVFEGDEAYVTVRGHAVTFRFLTADEIGEPEEEGPRRRRRKGGKNSE